MEKDRLTAFSDGVFAIIITIMVLDLRPPATPDLAALLRLAPVFLSYVLSFVYVAVYWNNHHHFFQLVHRVNGTVLWANLHLLFWLSLIPFTTAWLGAHPRAAWPAATYGASLLLPALAWLGMQASLIRAQGAHAPLARAIGRDLKGKASPACYALGTGLAFIDTRLADLVYVLMAVLWLVPDRRIERAFGAS